MKEITYTMQGDYLIPDLSLPEQQEVTLGKWAQMKKEYLKQHHKIMYYNLMTSCQLTQYLAETEQRALKLEDELIKEMSVKQGLTEELKAKDMMKWVQLMNNLRHEVQEIVTQQIIMSV
ncbi:MAG: TnpV protein [[Eubacterium] siraeum]